MSIKSKLKQIVTFIKGQTVYPKAYTIVLKDRESGTLRMYMYAAYDLETAIFETRNHFVSKGHLKVVNWEVFMYDSRDLKELVDSFTQQEIK